MSSHELSHKSSHPLDIELLLSLRNSANTNPTSTTIPKNGDVDVDVDVDSSSLVQISKMVGASYLSLGPPAPLLSSTSDHKRDMDDIHDMDDMEVRPFDENKPEDWETLYGNNIKKHMDDFNRLQREEKEKKKMNKKKKLPQLRKKNRRLMEKLKEMRKLNQELFENQLRIHRRDGIISSVPFPKKAE